MSHRHFGELFVPKYQTYDIGSVTDRHVVMAHIPSGYIVDVTPKGSTNPTQLHSGIPAFASNHSPAWFYIQH